MSKHHFFYFSKSERIGILVLAALCAIVFIIPFCLPDHSDNQLANFSQLHTQLTPTVDSIATLAPSTTVELEPFNPNTATTALLKSVGLSVSSRRSWLAYINKGGKFTKWEDIEKFRALSPQERERIRPYLLFPNTPLVTTKKPSTPKEYSLHAFNPNEVTKAELKEMGIPSKAANNWVKFLQAGGQFRKADDVQRIYGLTTAHYQRLAPFIQLPVPITEQATLSPQAKKISVSIDINQSSPDDWQQLRGIGPTYSRRICNFRDKLGGFINIDQVAETYGLPDSVFQAIRIQLTPSPILTPLLINQLTEEELAAHPYLRFKDAKLIIQYRQQHGPFQSTEDLDKLYGLSTATKEKILPYLSFN